LDKRDDIPMLIIFSDKMVSEQGNAVKKFSGDAVKLRKNND
jgi:hypothetical protein